SSWSKKCRAPREPPLSRSWLFPASLLGLLAEEGHPAPTTKQSHCNVRSSPLTHLFPPYRWTEGQRHSMWVLQGRCLSTPFPGGRCSTLAIFTMVAPPGSLRLDWILRPMTKVDSLSHR